MCSSKLLLIVSIIFSTLLISLVLWSSSGSMALYAATHHTPTILEPCKYLVNIDHGNFVGTYLMLDGAPKDQWEWSVVLRRVLYPLLAYPLMKMYGYMEGGLITNWLLHVGALIALILFVTRRYGTRAGFYAGVLFASYPGVAYWGGLPYSYASIVPASIACLLLLYTQDQAISSRVILLINASLGISFLAYDLFPFFGVASIGVLLLKRAWLLIVPSALLLTLPSFLFNYWLTAHYELSFNNANTQVYSNIIHAYLNLPRWSEWWPLIKEVPEIFLHNFLYSNFFVLPVFFACVLILRVAFRKKLGLNRVDCCVLGAALLIFLFNNLAPTYPGWQLRGYWIARLYQPIFAVMILSLVRNLAETTFGPLQHNMIALGLAIVVSLNSALAFGAILKLDAADKVYYEFYQHSHRGALLENLEKYGTRPYGMCAEVKKVKERRKNRKPKQVASDQD